MTKHKRTGRFTDTCLPSGVLAAALWAGATVGPWFRPMSLRGWPVLLAAVVATVVLPRSARRVWLYLSHSRRWKAALDAYAAREIARDRRGKAPPL